MTNKSCRICQNNSNSKENPLLSPCICKGSMKYIHRDCLNKWRLYNKDNEK